MNDEKEQALSLRANIVWNTAGNFIYLFCQWLLTYVVVKSLGFASAGVFSLAMTVANSFSVVATYTMRNFQTSDVEDVFCDRAYINSRILTCSIAFVCCVCFSLVNDYGFYVSACISVYMIFKISEALSDVYQGILQKSMRLDYVGISFVVKGIATLLLFYAAIKLTGSLLFAICALAVCSFLIVLVFDRKHALEFAKKATPARNATKDLLIACLPIAIYGFLLNVVGQAPRYFIESLLGDQALGFYASVAMPVVIVQVSASFIFSPLVTPLAASVSANEYRRYFAMIAKVLFFIALLAVFAFFAAFTVGNPILVLFFGNEISDYANLLGPLVGCSIATAIVWFLSAVLVIQRDMKSLVLLSAIACAIVIIGCVPAINSWGMNGASCVQIIALGFFSVGCLARILFYARTAKSHGANPILRR
ncbi:MULTISPECIES: lipopolysaccharide biosynthesis protein [unclassified Adlercreutzia]|uniref:lipopolysaccharide biosynthesis protein n=1 Tax=unclassified Adlercreutzia TaxID=2636013 RepID=UPI0013EE11E1|nr:MULTISPECIES: lipopolysaccharide biosynthesis protein [unclassified Adlercreutzia]